MMLVIDNHGFTTNILTHQLGAVHRVSATELETLTLTDYSHVVISHGPAPLDLTALLEYPSLPVLAIGAAAQYFASAYGHTDVAAAQPNYGEPVQHTHTATGLFTGVPTPTALTSYHPWRLRSMDPARFSVHAVDTAENVLAYRVAGTQHWGLHCDPAALQSPDGPAIIQNFLSLARHETPQAQPVHYRAAKRQRYRVYTREITGMLDTAATFRRLQSDASAAFWLDSSAAHLAQGQTSIMGTNRGPLAQTVRWDVGSQRIDIQEGSTWRTATGDVLEYLDANAWESELPAELPGFTGGWVGYLGYEAKQATVAGHTNRWSATTPDAYWIKPQSFLRYDHRTQVTTIFAYDAPQLLDTVEAALVYGDATSPDDGHKDAAAGRWRLTATQYEQRVADIQSMLHTGQAAGICLTDTFVTDDAPADGLDVYERLRTTNPAPYAGYLRFQTFDDALEILSASPEKFLSIDGAGRIESKPIKGTVARSSDPVTDAKLARQMATDPKFQSENLMITDLLRDDLANVAVRGTVEVPKLMAVESFATVHQLVTTVTAQLEPSVSHVEALRAVFPGGSMTGAPKLASLTALDRLEAGPRGIYSGAMGWLGDNNRAELNVMIRSIIIHDGHLSLGAGGAVVVGSDPADEEREKHLKARALFAVLGQ